jgi:hypothetical protein
MIRFLKGTASVLLAIALALTWTWTGWLKDGQYINDKQRLIILLILTLLLAMQQTYLVLPKPEKRGVVEERRAINEYYLKSFYLTYYEKLKSIPGAASPPIRLNIMLPTKRAKGLLGSYLQIYYYLVPPGNPYTDNERALRWRSKEGTCGWAWKCEVQSIFDSATPSLQLSDKRLDSSKRAVVGHINSALSVPIWYGTKVVGVFSLDSEQNVSQTYFNHPEIFTLAVAFARDFGAQCYPDGVES